jgi:hypothetical protein
MPTHANPLLWGQTAMSTATAHKPIVHFRRAAAVRMVSFSFSAAAMMAEPPMTFERETNEPKPACTYVVDPWKIRICSIGISSAPAAICAQTVSSPYPTIAEPT